MDKKPLCKYWCVCQGNEMDCVLTDKFACKPADAYDKDYPPARAC